jgi:hypothetical protein
MMAKSISKKEQSTKAETKYYYIMMDRTPKEFSGETVEEFLARGGKINKIEGKSMKSSLDRDPNGRFLKKETSKNAV